MVEIGYFNFNVNLTTHSAQACKNNLRRIEKRIKLILIDAQECANVHFNTFGKIHSHFVETFNIDECLVIVYVNYQLSHIFSSYVDSEAQDALTIYNILSLINT